jgi:chromate reductase, NAD(P)H dehydrogenase (quinone)
MRILAFAASLREGSLNQKLIEVAAKMARDAGADVDLARFREFEMPMYDGDVNERTGLPPGALELRKRLTAADAVMIATPEYNYSMPGTLKNAIDWVSRARPMPWRGKSVYLMSAAPSSTGGVRGLWHTRVPLEGCGALVFPDMFSLSHADQRFDGSGQLRGNAGERLQQEVVAFVKLAKTLAPVCTGDKRDREVTAALEDQSGLQSH